MVHRCLAASLLCSVSGVIRHQWAKVTDGDSSWMCDPPMDCLVWPPCGHHTELSGSRCQNEHHEYISQALWKKQITQRSRKHPANTEKNHAKIPKRSCTHPVNFTKTTREDPENIRQRSQKYHKHHAKIPQASHKHRLEDTLAADCRNHLSDLTSLRAISTTSWSSETVAMQWWHWMLKPRERRAPAEIGQCQSDGEDRAIYDSEAGQQFEIPVLSQSIPILAWRADLNAVVHTTISEVAKAAVKVPRQCGQRTSIQTPSTTELTSWMRAINTTGTQPDRCEQNSVTTSRAQLLASADVLPINKWNRLRSARVVIKCQI